MRVNPRDPFGPFPALRQVLEAKRPLGTVRPSDRHYGWTSVDDNDFELIRRRVAVAELIEERKHELLQVVREKPELQRSVLKELDELGGELRGLRDQLFDRNIHFLEKLLEEVYRVPEAGRGDLP